MAHCGGERWVGMGWSKKYLIYQEVDNGWEGLTGRVDGRGKVSRD